MNPDNFLPLAYLFLQRFDPFIGDATKFVMNLVFSVTRNESAMAATVKPSNKNVV